MMSTRWRDCFQGEDRTTQLQSTEVSRRSRGWVNGRDVPHDENERYFWLISHGY
jgi:hypothetical protein